MSTMKGMTMKYTLSGLFAGLLLLGAAATSAQEAADQPQAGSESDLRLNEADTLDQLLDNVQERRVVESRLHSEREARFRRDEDQQQQMLAEARAERTREEQRSERLETQFEENEVQIGDLQEALDRRLG